MTDGQDQRIRQSAGYLQVRRHIDEPGQEVCKTVGLAYVGSNPTPATTSGNGPWPGHTRARGPSSSCPAVSHDVPLRAPVLQWSGSGGALLRPRPLTTRRATCRGTGLKQAAWAGRLCFLRCRSGCGAVWVTGVAVSVHEAGVVIAGVAVRGVHGDRLAGDRGARMTRNQVSRWVGES